MAEHAVENSGLVLSDSAYDGARFFVEKVLPAAAVFYALLAGAWGWGYVIPVTASISGFAVFLGVVLTFARKGYKVTPLPEKYDGQVVESMTETGDPALRVELNKTATPNLLNKPVIYIKGFDASA